MFSLIQSLDLMPPGFEVQKLGRREYAVLKPGIRERVRATTDRAYYEEHSKSLELWSPGNPLFAPPEFMIPISEPLAAEKLKEILDS